MPDVRIEPMRVDDVDAVLDIERASFRSPWSRRAFLYELQENRVAHLWVARNRGSRDESVASLVAGYLCLWAIADEIHITNLAVRPAHRRRGIARFLLGALLEHYRQRGVNRVVLEVRPNNAEALGLYEGFGFRRVGRRKGYYFDTGEDALLLEADLGRVPVGAPDLELPPLVPRYP